MKKILRYCIVGFFIVYILILFRITFFKQVGLYNLWAAIGSTKRTISIIPFLSLFEMINKDISLIRILENVFGNIAIFIPFGLLLPAFLKEKSKKIIINGLVFSVLIEIIQFIFAMGSADIDDVIFNTSGVIIGYAIYNIIVQISRTDISALISITVLTAILGSTALGILFVNHTDLFTLSRMETVVENKELVQAFIDTPQYLSGKFVEVNTNILTVEKSVHNTKELRTLAELELTPESRIYICYDEINYFFHSISGEYISYEQIEYSDFISQKSNTFTRENNVRVWSSDGKTVDYLVIIEWI